LLPVTAGVLHPEIELSGVLGFPIEKTMQQRKRPGIRNNHDTGGRCKKAAEAVFEPSGARLSLHAVNSPPKRKRGHSGHKNAKNDSGMRLTDGHELRMNSEKVLSLATEVQRENDGELRMN